MTNFMMWSLIAGFFLPPVEAFLQQSHWATWFRAVVNFLACCAVAVGVVYWQEPTLDWHDWIKATLTVLVTAIAVYKGLWQPTTIAPKIENKTNLRISANAQT